MTDDDARLLVAQYKDAIEKLRTYIAKEPDGEKRAAASAKVTQYRDRIIDTAWQAITDRTEALNSYVDDLNEIIAGATEVPALSAAIEDLAGLVRKAGGVVTKARDKIEDAKNTVEDAAKRIIELACKTKGCVQKVKHTLSTATVVVGPGGIISVKLTCPKGHVHKYNISA